ncbi:MAG TPA: ATP-binding protein, partial [Solirubrobacterales bacterium]
SLLKLRGAYTQTNLDTLCQELGRMREGNGGHLDLSDLAALEPAALAVLLAALGPPREGALDGFVPPAETAGPACLQTEILRGLLQGDVGHWHQHPGGKTITGSEVFTDHDGIYRALKETAGRLGAIDPLPPIWMAAMHALGFELTNNVLRHSEASCGVVVVEIDPASGQLVLAIADSGVGIRRSLARNPDLVETGDLAAIRSAMAPQATGEPGRGAGMGLFLARKLVRDNGGTLLIRSGTASRELTPEPMDTSDRPGLQGTLVVASLKTNSPLDYGRIEQELLGPDGVSEAADD